MARKKAEPDEVRSSRHDEIVAFLLSHFEKLDGDAVVLKDLFGLEFSFRRRSRNERDLESLIPQGLCHACGCDPKEAVWKRERYVDAQPQNSHLFCLRACELRWLSETVESEERRFNVDIATEVPAGNGFIDLAIGGYIHCPNGGSLVRAAIVEVKSEREEWSAGDVLRQLKRYRKAFDRLLCETCRQSYIDAHGRYRGPVGASCRVPPSALALYAMRPVTEIERQLLQHEGVVILS